MTEGVLPEDSNPPPYPLPLLQYVQERALPQREGEFLYFFPKGVVGPLGNPPF